MNLKRALAGLASIMVVLSPMNIYADESTIVAQNIDGSITYTDYSSAWSAAKSGTPIIMLQDWTVNERLVVGEGENVTVYMNSHSISRDLSESAKNGEVIYLEDNGTLSLTGGNDRTVKVKDYKSDENGSIKCDITSGGFITGGMNTNNGGGILMDGGCTLNLDHVAIAGNYARRGGGILISDDPSTVNMSNGSMISYNSATYAGGGIQAVDKDANIILSASEISNNKADAGGGIYSESDGCYVTLNDSSKISENYATGKGGAICFESTYNAVCSNDSTGVISDNYAGKYAGAIYFAENGTDRDDVASAQNITFENNSTDAKGGAIYGGIDDLQITNCTFTSNSANQGGALYAQGDDIILENTTMEKNTVTDNGGAVYVHSSSDIKLKGALEITKNKLSDSSTENDIFLEKTWFVRAYVLGTPDDESQVGVLGEGSCTVAKKQTSDNKTIYCTDSNYYLEYDDGTLEQKSSSTSSVFGQGNTFIACVIMGSIAIIGGVILMVGKKSKTIE